MMAYGSLATPKKPEEEHKIHPGWRPRARLGRQFPSDSSEKRPRAWRRRARRRRDSPEARARAFASLCVVSVVICYGVGLAGRPSARTSVPRY